MTWKHKDIVPAWPACPTLDRVGACRAMLSIHGFLTDAENKRVADRIMKAVLKRAAQGKSEVLNTTGESK